VTGIGFAVANEGDNNTATAIDGGVADILRGSNNTAAATGSDGSTPSYAHIFYGDSNTATASGGCTAEIVGINGQTVTCP
jgi:hypothetical protein